MTEFLQKILDEVAKLSKFQQREVKTLCLEVIEEKFTPDGDELIFLPKECPLRKGTYSGFENWCEVLGGYYRDNPNA